MTSLGCLCMKPVSFEIFGCKYVCMYHIYSINYPRCLLNFWTFRMGTYLRLGFYKIFTIFINSNFNFIHIVTQINKCVLWCCLLVVQHPGSPVRVVCLFKVWCSLTFSAFRMGPYSRWALLRGWVLIQINMVCMYVCTGCHKSSFLYFVSLYFSSIGLGKQIISTKVVSFNIIHYFHTCCDIF